MERFHSFVRLHCHCECQRSEERVLAHATSCIVHVPRMAEALVDWFSWNCPVITLYSSNDDSIKHTNKQNIRIDIIISNTIIIVIITFTIIIITAPPPPQNKKAREKTSVVINLITMAIESQPSLLKYT